MLSVTVKKLDFTRYRLDSQLTAFVCITRWKRKDSSNGIPTVKQVPTIFFSQTIPHRKQKIYLNSGSESFHFVGSCDLRYDKPTQLKSIHNGVPQQFSNYAAFIYYFASTTLHTHIGGRKHVIKLSAAGS